jgi:hypothetical protein
LCSVQQIEEANAVGRSSETLKLAKQLSGKKSSGNIQPSKDDLGNVIADTDQQLELWAEFLDKKFSQDPEEEEVNLLDGNEEPIPPTTIEEA